MNEAKADKAIVLVKEFTAPSQRDALETALGENGMTEIERHDDMDIIRGRYAGDFETLRALDHVEHAGPEGELKPLEP